MNDNSPAVIFWLAVGCLGTTIILGIAAATVVVISTCP